MQYCITVKADDGYLLAVLGPYADEVAGYWAMESLLDDKRCEKFTLEYRPMIDTTECLEDIFVIS